MSPPAKKEEKPAPKTFMDVLQPGHITGVLAIVGLLVLAGMRQENREWQARHPHAVAAQQAAAAAAGNPDVPVAPSLPVAAPLSPGGTVVVTVPSQAAPAAQAEGESYRCDATGAPANPGTGWCRK